MTTRRRTSTSSRLARQAVELSIATPQVVAHRLTRMALAGNAPSARDRAEFQRMGTEKVAAFCESWGAMYAAMFRAGLGMAMAPLTPASAQRAALTVLGAGLGPVHRRATANARRMRKA